MKKIIFGSASAILAVVGFSAFKSAKTSTTTYYWFTADADNLTIGVKTDFTNSSAAFANTISSTVAPSSAICNKEQEHQCLVGFTAGQIFINGSGTKLLKTSGVVSGAPVNQPATTAPSAAQYTKS